MKKIEKRTLAFGMVAVCCLWGGVASMYSTADQGQKSAPGAEGQTSTISFYQGKKSASHLAIDVRNAQTGEPLSPDFISAVEAAEISYLRAAVENLSESDYTVLLSVITASKQVLLSTLANSSLSSSYPLDKIARLRARALRLYDQMGSMSDEDIAVCRAAMGYERDDESKAKTNPKKSETHDESEDTDTSDESEKSEKSESSEESKEVETSGKSEKSDESKGKGKKHEKKKKDKAKDKKKNKAKNKKDKKSKAGKKNKKSHDRKDKKKDKKKNDVVKWKKGIKELRKDAGKFLKARDRWMKKRSAAARSSEN
ncbi:MAG: hypothetical protein LBR89_02535 [Holosporales bacterium]|jgi:hypothetical protein|nr:hypothetical protein [Holosporales bacterium]